MLTAYRPGRALLLAILLLPPLATFHGCSGGRSTTTDPDRRAQSGRHDEDEDEDEREEEEREAAERGRPVPPMVWGEGMRAESVEGGTKELAFHLGSPLLVRLVLDGSRACRPFDGRPFYFDASGAQLGWGFEEVSDSVLFPQTAGRCERILLLSSEHSNRLAEGSYTFKAMVHLEDGTKIFSDTVTLNAVRAAQGADSLSYARFLQEQIVRHSPLLTDPETIRALFASGTPLSAESEVYHAVILQRAGDAAGARNALAAAHRISTQRKLPLARPARDAWDILTRMLATAEPKGR